MINKISSALFFILTLSLFTTAGAGDLPEGFVYIDEVITDITVELRYAGSNNFIGQPIDGYESGRCIISTDAAYALKRAQAALKKFGLGLKIFDAYRPQRAVDNFVRWAADTLDTRMKQQYYPTVRKSQLFDKGYIAEKSGHSRGSTVDLTLIDLNTGKELDMGSPWDFFGEKSHIDYSGITAQQRANRMLINFVLTEYGFSPYSNEWWHFTLRNEPFPKTYFDFVIK
jgi:D-alanyl-D-alanine dipeptidase